MTTHSSERDFMHLLKEKDFFTEHRWENLVDEGLNTMEQIAHYCCPGGDISQPIDTRLSIKMIKLIEGDWTEPTQQYNSKGKAKWRVKESAKDRLTTTSKTTITS